MKIVIAQMKHETNTFSPVATPLEGAAAYAAFETIAAILELAVIEKILAHLGLDAQPPPKGRVREAELHFAA